MPVKDPHDCMLRGIAPECSDNVDQLYYTGSKSISSISCSTFGHQTIKRPIMPSLMTM